MSRSHLSASHYFQVAREETLAYTRADLTILNHKQRIAAKPRPRENITQKIASIRGSERHCHSEPQAKNLGGGRSELATESEILRRTSG